MTANEQMRLALRWSITDVNQGNLISSIMASKDSKTVSV
jgi:hypothetical protein